MNRYESFRQSGPLDQSTKQAHVKIPAGRFEEEHGRKGFYGRVSHLYHQHPPTSWTHIEGDLKPRALPPSFHVIPENQFVVVLHNNDVKISLGRYTQDYEHFFRNADFDDLFFVHRGAGRLETNYGPIPFAEGDYIVLPRGTTYKLYLSQECHLLRIESSSEFEQPDRGPLGVNALYDQSALFIPTASPGSEQDKKEYKVEILRTGKITTVTYPFNPLDVSGWKGSLYPWKLSIFDFCPVMSHKYHIPPSGHTTFVARNFVVCSFVARPLEDSREEVLKVPFYHSNIDYDEVIFYHAGDFFSRDDIDPGSITFHPQGIHHGPHPKAFKNANDKTHTDEYSVMVDTRYPLQRTKWFSENENKKYFQSWME